MNSRLEEFKKLGEKANQLKGQLSSEEATKMALVLPFIKLLGYDVFNSKEVIPELSAQAWEKKDARVDYAICKEGEPIILIECKCLGTVLDRGSIDQLKRYFPFVETARVAAITDGNFYKFFCDLDKDNVMDDTPYLEFSLDSITEDKLEKLLSLEKSTFSIKNTIALAEELKYTEQFKMILSNQYEAPEDKFVSFFCKQVCKNQPSSATKEKLTPLLKEAFRQWVNEKINSRLQKAKEADDKEAASDEISQEENAGPNDDEKFGLGVITAILSDVCDPGRLSLKVQNTYTPIFLDGSVKKTIVRLIFRDKPIKIRLCGIYRDDRPLKINEIRDIYKYKNKIIEIFNHYEHPELSKPDGSHKAKSSGKSVS